MCDCFLIILKSRHIRIRTGILRVKAGYTDHCAICLCKMRVGFEPA